ncbi:MULTISPECIES: hypothetical protein [unclassified Sinorhizobium]
MNRNTRRARAIAIAATQSNVKVAMYRFLMLATGATAACIAFLALRAV